MEAHDQILHGLLDMGQMLLGQHGGSIGEVSIFMLLLGGLYLARRRSISSRSRLILY